jgi:hypothetical protein
VGAVFRAQLQFEEEYITIRSKFSGASCKAISNKLSSIRTGPIGRWDRPREEERREQEREKIRTKVKGGENQIYIYDLLCAMDDKRYASLNLSNTRETPEDMVNKAVERKRKREEDANEIRRMKLNAVEKRRATDAEAKKKAAASVESSAKSMERASAAIIAEKEAKKAQAQALTEHIRERGACEAAKVASLERQADAMTQQANATAQQADAMIQQAAAMAQQAAANQLQAEAFSRLAEVAATLLQQSLSVFAPKKQ